MTEIHAFDPDGTPSPGAQIALDNAIAGVDVDLTGYATQDYVDDAVASLGVPEGAVSGVGVSQIVVLTQAEYDALTPDGDTVYIIRGLSSTPDPPTDPDAGQELGTPVVTRLATATDTSITPRLPSVPSGHWGYLVVVVGQTPSAAPWAVPAGWQKLADHADLTTYSVRPVGVFAAPATTPSTVFVAPSGGQQRYVAVAYPVSLAPSLTGHSYSSSNEYDRANPLATAFASPSVPLTIVTTNYSSASGSGLPTMQGAQLNAGSGPAVVSGSGSVTMLHAIVGSRGVSSVPAASYLLSEAMASSVPSYVFGIGVSG